MTRILVGDKELEVAEPLEDVLGRISRALEQGPTERGIRVLPSGWIIVHSTQMDSDLYVQTAQIGYVQP